jgi:hypothetical protein
VTVPVKDVNRPRTFVIMRWRAVKPTMLWLGSTFQTPGVRSDTLLMGSSRGEQIASTMIVAQIFVYTNTGPDQ